MFQLAIRSVLVLVKKPYKPLIPNLVQVLCYFYVTLTRPNCVIHATGGLGIARFAKGTDRGVICYARRNQ